MKNKYDITDAELEIMKVLWSKEPRTLPEIVEELDKTEKRNKNTIKTLVYRLIEKGAIKSKKTVGKLFEFSTNIREKEFLRKENSNFLEKLYEGKASKLLFNFVEEKKISKDEIKKLLDILEE